MGVRTVRTRDAWRERDVTVEVWYPGGAEWSGMDGRRRHQDRYRFGDLGPPVRQAAVRDLPPADVSAAPLVLFSHGLGGFRRQSTFLTTHLASHGYVVAAPDHGGSTLMDMVALRRAKGSPVRAAILGAARDRLADIPFLVGTLPEACPDLLAPFDGRPVGLAGHSFGGWTTVCATSIASPVQCALALAPIGSGPNPAFGNVDAYAPFTLDWAERPPTLILSAERDSICRARGIRRLHEAMGPPHRHMVLRDAEHFHFCDYVQRVHRTVGAFFRLGGLLGRGGLRLVPMRALIGETRAHAAIRAVGLAHFDAHLRGAAEAVAFLDDHLPGALTESGDAARAKSD